MSRQKDIDPTLSSCRAWGRTTLTRIANYLEAAEWNAKQREAANRTRAGLENSPGGLRAFRDSLRFSLICPDGRPTPDDEKLLNDYLRVLSTGILADELASREDF